MYCHDCGTANTVDSKYCKECGTKINDGYRTMMLSVQDLPVNQSEEALVKLTRLLDMAFWHNEAGNRDAAITAAEAALAINPNSTTAHSLLGTLYEKRGDDVRAIEHFESVLALNPDSAADAAKLDQIRRGVHVKAVTPPAAHVWLPPGLVRLTPLVLQSWTVLTADKSDKKPGSTTVPRRPLIAAGVTAGLVLVFGLLLFRPWAKADTVAAASPAIMAPGPVSVSHSAFAASVPSPTVISPPMILTPGPNTAASYYAPPPAPAMTGHDPFAGNSVSVPPVSRAASSPAWSLPAVPRLPAAARRRLARRDLPALRLSALPAAGSGEIAPAPVFVPDGGPMATVANIPQHTVVVSSLGSPQNAPADFVPPSTSGSHIRITVRQATPSDAEKVADASEDGGDAAVKPDVYQQRALSLQQGGNYGQARAAYQRAIRAYAGQIAAGHNVETAQRGLAACQTGLQICQQSQ